MIDTWLYTFLVNIWSCGNFGNQTGLCNSQLDLVFVMPSTLRKKSSIYMPKSTKFELVWGKFACTPGFNLSNEDQNKLPSKIHFMLGSIFFKTSQNDWELFLTTALLWEIMIFAPFDWSELLLKMFSLLNKNSSIINCWRVIKKESKSIKVEDWSKWMRPRK